MSGHVGYLVLYNNEAHFMVPADHLLVVSDTFEMIRGNGPREGDVMGVATIIRFEDGLPVIQVRSEKSQEGEPWRSERLV
jgi:hypothetical protein